MSFKTGMCSRVFDIGSIQILKAISWVGEGIVKVRYRITEEENALIQTPFVDTDIDRFSGPILSSKFMISKTGLDVSTGNALVVSGLIDSSSHNLQFLPDTYGGEIKTVDSLGESFTVQALMQLSIPAASVGGNVYLAVKSDDGYGEDGYGQEIKVQKRIVKSNNLNINGFQEILSGATMEVDGYSYPVIVDPNEVRSIEEHKVENKIINELFVEEIITRNAFDEFITSLPIKSLSDAYGDTGVYYNIDKNDDNYLLTKDVIDDEINLLNAEIQTLDYEPFSDEWVAADVDHRWTTQIFLERGTYHYNFIITTQRPSGIEQSIEIQDPRNVHIITNDFGLKYSVIEIMEPSLITFAIYVAAAKVSIVGTFNDFIPDRNLLQMGFDATQVVQMIRGEQLYKNSNKDWNKIDIYLNKPVFIDKLRFETETDEDERQRVLILLDDKIVSREEYEYISGRDLSNFQDLPVPRQSLKTILTEFDEGFDDIPDAYGYIDTLGQINEVLLAEVLADANDAYGLTIEERYTNWRQRTIASFSTDDGYGYNTIKRTVEYFNLTPLISQVTLRESPDEDSLEIIRTDSYTEDLTDFLVSDFDISNRVITITPELERGVYQVIYQTTIYGGSLINADVLEDTRGNRYKYISGSPASGAIVEVQDIINIISLERGTFQLSHYPNLPYSAITIKTLGLYTREVNVDITVNDQTLDLNSYLQKGTYVVFFTNITGENRAETNTFLNVFNTIDLIDLPDETKDITLYFVEVPALEKLNVISIDGRIVTFNSPSQSAIYRINYKVRDFNPTLSDAVWISKEDGYGEWNYRHTGGDEELDAFDGYGSDRKKVTKVSLLTKYDSLSGNPRQHKAFEIFTNEGTVQTFTDFSLRFQERFEAYLIDHSLLDPQLSTSKFPTTTDYVTVAGADGSWELPVTLYGQENKLTVTSEYFKDEQIVNSKDAIYPSELFEEQNPSIIEVVLPEPYIEPFINLNTSSNTELTVKYGTEQYFLANIYDVLKAEDGYGTFEGINEIVRINDNEWWFQRWAEVFQSFVQGEVIFVSGTIVRLQRTEELNDVNITPNLSRLSSILLSDPILITIVDNSNLSYIELTLASTVSSTLLNTGIRVEFSAGFQYVTDYILNKERYTVTALNTSDLAEGSLSVTYHTPVEAVAIPYKNFRTLPSENSQFVVGNTVDIDINDIQSKIRINDLRQLQVVFFVGETGLLPNSIELTVNNYGIIQLLPDTQTDAYGDLVFDGYGTIVTYEADLKNFFDVLNINNNEVIEILKLSFTATSEQMILGKISLLSTYQQLSTTCEVLVNGELKYRSILEVDQTALDPYTITVTERKFAVLYKDEPVYYGSLNSINNPYVIMGASPREYDQNIEAKLGIYELRRYMLLPENLNVIGRYTEAEITLDDYDNNVSKLKEIDFIVEYEQPQFPKRPKIVDI